MKYEFNSFDFQKFYIESILLVAYGSRYKHLLGAVCPHIIVVCFVFSVLRCVVNMLWQEIA